MNKQQFLSERSKCFNSLEYFSRYIRFPKGMNKPIKVFKLYDKKRTTRTVKK